MIFLAFVVYFLILLTIGFASHRKSKTESDFILGDRSLSFWLTALSAHAADMSAWLFMALPAAVFIGGMQTSWMALGLFLGMFLNWQFVAPRLRSFTEETGSYTLSTFFEKRFNDPSGWLRLLTALFLIFFMTVYLAAGLVAMGFLFEALFSIDYYIGIALAISAVVAYTFVGGFVAVAWTDLFQALFLLSVVIFVPFYALGSFGGFEVVQQAADAKNISLSLLPDPSLQGIFSIAMIALGWGLGYFGQPHIITKFMGIRDVKEMGKAKILGMTWQSLALFGACFIGVVGIGFFPQGIVNDELVFVEMVKNLFSPFFGGLILCAVLAANISTMDSQLLVSASTVAEDLYKRFFNKSAASALLLKVSRCAVVGIGALALFIASFKNTSVLGAVFYAWGGLGASFGPLVIAALYMKSATRTGAICGMLIGGIIGALWPLINPLVTVWAIPAMVPGFLFGLLGIYGISCIKRS